MAASKLVLNRNFVLTSTKGHSVKFEKGVPVHVPPALYAEALAIGAQTEDGKDLITEEPTLPRPPSDPAERQPAVLKAVKDIRDRNDVDDFSASGTPKVEAVSKLVGFKVTGKEVHAAMQALYDAEAADKLNG